MTESRTHIFCEHTWTCQHTHLLGRPCEQPTYHRCCAVDFKGGPRHAEHYCCCGESTSVSLVDGR